MRFNVQEAKKAIREMNGATIAGQEIKVGKSWKPPELETKMLFAAFLGS